METIDNTQSTTFNVNKSNICTATEAYSTLGVSPNQPIIQYSEGSTPHIPPSSHVSASTLINIYSQEQDVFDHLMNEDDALMKFDKLCQETHEL